MRIAVAIFFALTSISAPAHAGRFASLIANAAAATRPGPAPVTPVVPAGSCDNCDGRGKIGDGVTMITCPVCNGTGKRSEASSNRVPVATSRPTAQRRGHYEERTVCYGGSRGCRTVRVFVPD